MFHVERWVGRGTMWGAAPHPGRGLSPLHPIIGASPQGDNVFGGVSLPGPCVPIWGCAPSPSRAPCRVASFYRKRSGMMEGDCPLFGASFPRIKRVSGEGLAWGFGAEPQMGTQSQSREPPTNSSYLWGEAPMNGVQGDYPPARGLGAAPPTSPSHASSLW